MSNHRTDKSASSTAVAAQNPAVDAAHGKKGAKPARKGTVDTSHPNVSPGQFRSAARKAKRRKKRGRKRSWSDRWVEAFGAGACEFVSLVYRLAQEKEPLDWDSLSEEDKLTFSCKREAS
ncbi:hypothetical protein [Azohydromonas aeria]|uniref:hypothetical protein n=1 Tax=Azohydromonas aeria TaxID=2590212 RepID=UPI0012FBAAED|nr:hypothetical protein [Azohydromonas aeria]